MRFSRPLPISLPEPCIGNTERFSPRHTCRCPPRPGTNVQPLLSSQRLSSALVNNLRIQHNGCVRNTSVVLVKNSAPLWYV